jgi:hypothetical protein
LLNLCDLSAFPFHFVAPRDPVNKPRLDRFIVPRMFSAMSKSRQPKPVPPFTAVVGLSQRFSAAGGKRILITYDTAELVSRALLAYADMTANRRDDDFNFYKIEAWDAAENHSELLAKCCNSSIALAAFESAKAERPRSVLTLRKGAHLMQRHRPEKRSADA